MTKIMTLNPDGSTLDLGDVDLRTDESTLGTDSKQLAEEYPWRLEWETSDEQVYVADTVENTGELKYVLVIHSSIIEGENTTSFSSELIPNKIMADKKALYNSIITLPDIMEKVAVWAETDTPYAKDLEDFINDSIEESEYTLAHTLLSVVPVDLSKRVMKGHLDTDEDSWKDRLRHYYETGDWRHAASELAFIGCCAPVKSWKSYVKEGEWPIFDIDEAKGIALQVQILFGFKMDRVVNGLGETGWNLLRNAGVIFPDDEVIWDDNPGNWTVVTKNEDHYILTDGHKEREVAYNEVRSLSFSERLKKRLGYEKNPLPEEGQD